MSKENHIIKTRRITVRLSETDIETLLNKSRIAGLPPSSFLRNVGLRKEIRQRTTPEELEAFKSIIKMQNNLNQLVKSVHIHGPYSLLPQIESTISDLNLIIKKLK